MFLMASTEAKLTYFFSFERKDFLEEVSIFVLRSRSSSLQATSDNEVDLSDIIPY